MFFFPPQTQIISHGVENTYAEINDPELSSENRGNVLVDSSTGVQSSNKSLTNAEDPISEMTKTDPKLNGSLYANEQRIDNAKELDQQAKTEAPPIYATVVSLKNKIIEFLSQKNTSY